MTTPLTLIEQVRCHGGWIKTFSHPSVVNQCTMRFAIYLPPQAQADANKPLPVLYWLSGLTCTERNFMEKSGVQQYAAEHGIVVVAPDTSPRGDDIPTDPDGSWDFGHGAGFYLNATQAPWAKNYQMYDYVVKELPSIIHLSFAVDPLRKSISGHSMGGHGALMIALRNPGVYRSVSAFAPIVAPTQCPWGHKAFNGYLGDIAQGQAYDSCYLIENPVDPTAAKQTLLISQGEGDSFLAGQLKPELIEQSCDKMNHPLQLDRHPGYDHSYFFISSFIGQHLAFHAAALNSIDNKTN